MRKKNSPISSMAHTSDTRTEKEMPEETTIVSVIKENKLECSTCGRKFHRKDTLKRHEMKHTGEKTPHYCDICNKHFRGKWELGRHNATHQKKVLYCDTCMVEFSSQSALVNHEVSSHGANSELIKYACPVCKRVFSNRYGYEGHLRKHKKNDVNIDVDVVDISCKKCGKMFTYQQSLTRHEKVCDSENYHNKSFICPHVPCRRRFTNKKGLSVHIKTIHEKKFYTCSCGKSYSYTSGLWKHKKTCGIPAEEKIVDIHEQMMATNSIEDESIASMAFNKMPQELTEES